MQPIPWISMHMQPDKITEGGVTGVRLEKSQDVCEPTLGKKGPGNEMDLHLITSSRVYAKLMYSMQEG
ncbi:MAG TPA: hypothetical protein VN426_03480 [Syntrophomonadaceae bacterium]|nr:hypothetical protein [Syntrophomonadaceae bacterium]